MASNEIRVPVPGGDLAVTDHGGQGQDVMLVHSVGYCDTIWNEFAPQLSLDTRVVSFDARGHGASTAEFTDPGESTGDVVAIIEALGLQRPILVGHQFGGCTVASVAAQCPGLLSAICLIDSPVLEPRGEFADLVGVLGTDELVTLHASRWGFGAAGPDAASRHEFVARYTRLIAADWLGGGSTAVNARAHLERSITTGPDGSWQRRPDTATLQAMARGAARAGATSGREAIEDLQLPVWVIAPRDGDFYTSNRDFAEVAAQRPGWEMREVRGDSHAVQNQPEIIRAPLAQLIRVLSAHQGQASLSRV